MALCLKLIIIYKKTKIKASSFFPAIIKNSTASYLRPLFSQTAATIPAHVDVGHLSLTTYLAFSNESN